MICVIIPGQCYCIPNQSILITTSFRNADQICLLASEEKLGILRGKVHYARKQRCRVVGVLLAYPHKSKMA